MKINWKQIRIPFLTLTFGSVLLVLGKVILIPPPEKPKLSKFVFPDNVPLPQWQQSENHSLSKPQEKETQFISQKDYLYNRNNKYLDIEMRYLPLPGGDFMSLLRQHQAVASSPVVRQHEKIGFYVLGVDKQQQAYLSTCINPRGGTTVTFSQFNKNRYLYDLQPQRLVSWLFGKHELFDRRCLWTHMSLPIKDSSPKATFQTLETAWLSWYQWWQSRFPKP
ncbi:MAG: cyanoexosortase A system-associated protein [Cyanobacteria bacterium J06632_19]